MSVWIFVFLFFTEPLDVSELNQTDKLTYLPGYGLIVGVGYLVFVPFQYFLFKKNEKQWKLITEITFLLAFSIFSLTVARLYYLFVVVAGEPNPYSLSYMLKAILLPALATILPIVVIARFAFGKYHEKKLEDAKIEIKGEGNYEGLRLNLNDLITIQSSDNYIEVFYRSGNNLKKTLIRNKLSVIDKEFQELQRTHRSYLINPYHFQQWKTENGKHFLILNHEIEVPISKTYITDVKVAVNYTTN